MFDESFVNEEWYIGLGSSRGLIYSGSLLWSPVKGTIGYPTLLCIESESQFMFHDPYLTCFEAPMGKVNEIDNSKSIVKIFPTILKVRKLTIKIDRKETEEYGISHSRPKVLYNIKQTVLKASFYVNIFC